MPRRFPVGIIEERTQRMRGRTDSRAASDRGLFYLVANKTRFAHSSVSRVKASLSYFRLGSPPLTGEGFGDFPSPLSFPQSKDSR